MKKKSSLIICVATLIILLLFIIKHLANTHPEKLSHGRFEQVALYKAIGETHAFVLLLADQTSEDTALQNSEANLIKTLQQQGAMVARVDVPQLFANLETDTDECVFADGDLENLAHYLQGYAQLNHYFPPLLVGYKAGASLVYAMLAQAPTDTFTGGLSFGFEPELALKKPLCPDNHLGSTQQTSNGNHYLVVNDAIKSSWIHLPALTAPISAQDKANYLAGYHQLISRSRPLDSTPAILKDLPLIECTSLAQANDNNILAILLSGDGGWAGLDKAVADALVSQGIPVVGFDSLRYFWQPRTPQGLADDLNRVVRFYVDHWHKPNVILIGYSQGADVLPFAINRLPLDTQRIIRKQVLMGLAEKATFEFHLENWLYTTDDGKPIAPEMDKLTSNTLCIYGDEEEDSLCPQLTQKNIQIQKLPGDHHFNEDYSKLSELILAPSS